MNKDELKGNERLEELLGKLGLTNSQANIITKAWVETLENAKTKSFKAGQDDIKNLTANIHTIDGKWSVTLFNDGGIGSIRWNVDKDVKWIQDKAKLDERNRIITLIKTRIDEYEKLINKEIIIQKEAEHLLNYDIDEDRQFLDQHVLKSKTMATHKKMWLLKKIYVVEELQQLIKQLEAIR